MQRVRFMLQDEDGNDIVETLKKKKQDKRNAVTSNRVGQIAASRSADGKQKGKGGGLDDDGTLSDRDDYSARRPHPHQSSAPPAAHQQSHRHLTEAQGGGEHGGAFSPLKPLELPLQRSDSNTSPRQQRPYRASKSLASPSGQQGGQAMFPAIVKPVKASKALGGEEEAEYESFSSPVLSVVVDDDKGSAGVANHPSPVKKDEARGHLVLDHVHGYDGEIKSGRGGGRNILWLTRTVVAYPAASLVVLMDVKSSKQLFFSGHSEETCCLALHPDGNLMASGQMGKRGSILVWDTSIVLDGGNGNGGGDEAVVKELNIENGVKGVSGVSFSGDGQLLTALGLDENKSMYVFNWERGEMLASVKLGHVDVFQMGFNPFLYVPLPPRSEQDDGLATPMRRPGAQRTNGDEGECCYTLVTCGTRYVKFWVLRHVKERTDISAVSAQGSQFKGKKLAVPKSKQQWAWKYELEGNVGLFPKKNGDSPPDMTCFCAISEPPTERGGLPSSRILTGGSNGSVYIWQQLEAGPETARETGSQFWLPRGRLLCVVTDVHDGPLYDIDHFTPALSRPSSGALSEQLHRVITCSKDGLLNVWRLDSSNPTGDASPMEHLTAVNVSGHSVSSGLPRSVAWSFDGSRAVVGTTGNSVCLARGKGLHSDIETTGQLSESAPVGDVHLDVLIHANVGKIKRVVPHPLLDMFATIATDKTVRVWSSNSMAQIALTRVASCATAITFTPDGSALAVGTDVGEVLILTCTYLQSCLEHGVEPAPSRRKVKWELLGRKFVGLKNGSKGKGGAGARGAAKHEITELKYSPGGDVLAVTGRDKAVHFLSAVVSVFNVSSCISVNLTTLCRLEWLQKAGYMQGSQWYYFPSGLL